LLPAALAQTLIVFAPPVFADADKSAMFELTRGDRLKERGQINEAFECYAKAVKLAPRNYYTHRSLGEILGAQKKYDEALKEVNIALSLNNKDGKLYVHRGLYYMGLGKPALAEADFKRSLSEPHCGHAVYKYLEDIYKNEGRIDDAIAVCELQIKRDGGNDVMYRHKAGLYLDKKDYVGARKILVKATAAAPLNFANYEMDADVCLAMGQTREALALYTKCLSLEPFFPSEIYLKRARAYAKLGDTLNEKKDIESAHNKD